MINQIFIDRLRTAMNAQNMSGSELALRCGLNKSAICRYLNGKINPKLSAIDLMAQALGVSSTWLLGYDTDMKLTEIPPLPKREYNPIDYNKLSPVNKIKIKAYYQALLDTQTKNS